MARREVLNGIKLPKYPFWRGVARLFDFSGELDRELIEQIRRANALDLYPTEESSAEPQIQSNRDGWKADSNAIRADWRAVGDDMRWAIGDFEKRR